MIDPRNIFFQFALAIISFAFFIAAAINPLTDDTIPRSKPLLALLIVISILSGTAGFLQLFTDKTIDDLNASKLSNYDENPSSTGVVDRLQARQWSETVKSLLHPSRSVYLFLHGPAVTLLIYLVARLFAVNNFRSQPASFDFGPRDGRIESDGSFEENIPFTPELVSFLHSSQGVIAALFSFPAVSGWIARIIGSIGRRGSMVHFGRVHNVLSTITLIYSISTIYPTYNLIKRVSKDGSSFASTSYANNGMEWSMGYALGVALGMLLTAVTSRLLILVYPPKYDGGLEAFMKTFDVHCWNDTSNTNQDEPKYLFGKLEDYPATPSKSKCSLTCLSIIFCNNFHNVSTTVVTVLSNLFLGIFVITTFLCGIFLGTTWNNCPKNDGDECINSTTNGVDMGSRLTVAFVFVFIAIELMFIGISVQMQRTRT